MGWSKKIENNYTYFLKSNNGYTNKEEFVLDI